MGVRMSEDEAWEFVSRFPVGTLTTLRANGLPVSLPVWFVVLDRTICLSTPAGTKKVLRVRHDPRAAFLVQTGEAWAQLAAVHLTGAVHEVRDDDVAARVTALLDDKYAALRTPAQDLPASARRAYAERVVLRFVPAGRLLSWDNGRIVSRPAGPPGPPPAGGAAAAPHPPPGQ
jgi:nitroimidazol reductase NimA-like FMN-containing flavoprotein (pyridoxamine 5'-phosphate oxidase superfamily)